MKITKILDNLSSPKNGTNIILMCFSLVISFPLLNGFSFLLKPENMKNNLNSFVAFIAIAFTFSTLFINYSNNFIKEDKKREEIKNLVDGLLISLLFPIFSLLFIISGINFGRLNFIVSLILVIFIFISVSILTFCLIKLWWFIMRNFIERIQKNKIIN